MNREIAREVALQIRKEEGAHWFQGSWWGPSLDQAGRYEKMPVAALLERRCGTTGCVAGWTVALSYPDAVFDGSSIVISSRNTVPIRMEAAERLGLTWPQVKWLFAITRDLDEVLWALENDDPHWDPADYPKEG